MHSNQRTSQTKKRTSILLATMLLIVGGGAIDGYFANRWISSNALEEAAEVLSTVPSRIGDWEGKDFEIPPEHLKISGAVAYLQRVYTNQTTGEQVSVMSLCGPHGPISLHPPTVCFTGVGWNLSTKLESHDYCGADERSCTFWQATFSRPQEFGEETILTDWAWNDGHGWNASDDPRFEFAGSSYLFKLYFTSTLESGRDDFQKRREEFVKEFVKEFQRTVIDKLSATQPQDG